MHDNFNIIMMCYSNLVAIEGSKLIIIIKVNKLFNYNYMLANRIVMHV